MPDTPDPASDTAGSGMDPASDPAGPIWIRQTQISGIPRRTRVYDAVSNTMTASDNATALSSTAADATMTLATLQTGDDSNSDAMGGREAATAASEAADDAADAARAAADAAAAAAAATTGAEAEAALRMALDAQDAAEAAEATAAEWPRRRSQPR